MEELHAPQSVEPVPQPGSAELLKELSPSLLWAGLLGFFFSLPGAGFGVVFIILPQIVMIPARLFMAIMKPVDRRQNLGRAIIWLAAIASIYLVHYVRDEINRKYADEVVARIEAYRAAHGKCAARIEDVGVSHVELEDKLGGRRAFYICDDGKGALFYPPSFNSFDSWVYDFERHEWHYFVD